MKDVCAAALKLWGLEGADCAFVAGRENQVFRVDSAGETFALRIKRPGYRTKAELQSELDWMAAMDAAGLAVPRPQAALSGRLIEEVEGYCVDLISWLDGTPLGTTGQPLELSDAEGTFETIGGQLALIHDASDAWIRPEGFERIAWDLNGLRGEAPLWGRFWENPTLDAETRALFARFRDRAMAILEAKEESFDFGLIHADFVRENVLLSDAGPQIIDFDDGGFGYRLFDVATALLKNQSELNYPDLEAALIQGYQQHRPLDTTLLPLFLAIRAMTYVGWIIPRMEEPGGKARNERFITQARRLCLTLQT
mgnify:FL=1